MVALAKSPKVYPLLASMSNALKEKDFLLKAAYLNDTGDPATSTPRLAIHVMHIDCAKSC